MAAALAAKGGLFLIRAKASRDPAVRTEEARRASAALAEALRENPLLERGLRPALEEADRTAQGAPKAADGPAGRKPVEPPARP